MVAKALKRRTVYVYHKTHSFIPMSPELLPLQKLNEVVTVPGLPHGLAPKVEWVEPLLRDRPKASPRPPPFSRVSWSQCIIALITTI